MDGRRKTLSRWTTNRLCFRGSGKRDRRGVTTSRGQGRNDSQPRAYLQPERLRAVNNFGRPTPIRFPAQHVPMGFRGNKMFPEPHFAQGGVAPMPGGSVGPGAPMPTPTFIGHTEPPGILNPHQPVGPIHQPVPGMGPFRRMSPFPLQQFRRGGVALPTGRGDPGSGGLFPPPDFPPADPSSDYNYNNGPTVLINPTDTPYRNPFGSRGAPSTPSVPGVTVTSGPEPDPYGGIPNSPWYTAGPFAGGNQNPNNPGYVAPGVGPQGVVGQGGQEGTGDSFNFLMGHQQLKKGGVAAPNLSPKLGDVVPADLTPGEVVLNAPEQRKILLSKREKKSLPPAIVSQMYRNRMGR